LVLLLQIIKQKNKVLVFAASPLAENNEKFGKSPFKYAGNPQHNCLWTHKKGNFLDFYKKIKKVCTLNDLKT